jgi:uncharacterized membrane protein
MSTLVVSPNRSLHGAELRLIGAGLAGSLALGGLMTWLWGFWPILAFNAIALAGLVYGVWKADRHARYREVIRVDDDWLVVEKGLSCPEYEFRAARVWTQVRAGIRPSDRKYHVTVRSSGKECEVGGCLGEEERRILARRLREMLAPALGDAAPALESGPGFKTQVGDLRS